MNPLECVERILLKLDEIEIVMPSARFKRNSCMINVSNLRSLHQKVFVTP